MRPRRAVLAVAVLVLSGCGGGGGSLPTATVPTAPAQTTTTDPYAVPPVIDAAYVSRVISGLDQIKGDVAREVARTRTIPREAFDRLRAIYLHDADVDLVLRDFSREVSQGLPNARPDPGNQVTTIRELLSVRPTCIFAMVERDYSPIGLRASTNSVEWIAIRPRNPARDPSNYNSTGWSYGYEGFSPGRTPPEKDPCAA